MWNREHHLYSGLAIGFDGVVGDVFPPSNPKQVKETTAASVLAVDDQALQELLARGNQGDMLKAIDAISHLSNPKSLEDPRTKPHRAARLLIQAIRDALIVHHNPSLAEALAEGLNKPDIRRKLSKNQISTTEVNAVFIILGKLKGHQDLSEQAAVVEFLTSKLAEDSEFNHPR